CRISGEPAFGQTWEPRLQVPRAAGIKHLCFSSRVLRPQEILRHDIQSWISNAILTRTIQGDAMNRSLAALALCLLVGPAVFGQGRGGAPPAPRPPKAMAPFDMTGYWISVVSEDWRWRMFTPVKGDYTGVPLNAEGKKIADAWDPAKDEAAGEQCKSYGAANIMRVPGSLRITWQDDQTLKIETDAGTQTRLFSFGAPDKTGDDWQGVSKASWELTPAAGGFSFG